MGTDSKVSQHYTHGGLTAAIEQGVVALGKTTDSITIDDLGAVDEFHIGGRVASIAFLDQLGLSGDEHVLDVGCGLGGASRFVESRYGTRISGIDITAEYIETGRDLCAWLGLEHRISLHHGSVLEMPFEDRSFDHGYMMHVGMNITDKASLFAEVARVLKAGGNFGVYDVMRIGDGELAFPVPWATTAEISVVSSPSDYKESLIAAGFTVVAERNRHAFALEFFDELRAKVAAAGGPPPLGLHLLMGESAPIKRKNMIENISAGRLAPVEIIAQKN